MEKVFWYHDEPTWQGMKDARMGAGNASTWECNFSYDQDAQSTAKVAGGMQGIGLEMGGSTKSHAHVNQNYVVEFYDKARAGGN